MAVSNLEVVHTGENERIVKSDSADIYLRRKDPYGFWYISFERGATPAYLKDAFTNPVEALKKIETYMATARTRKPTKTEE